MKVGSCAADIELSLATARRSLATTYAWTIEGITAAEAAKNFGVATAYSGSEITGVTLNAATVTITKDKFAAMKTANAWVKVSVTITPDSGTKYAYPKYF